MRIPKSFMLQGIKVRVKYDKSLFHNDDVHGWAKYRQSEIILQPVTEQTPITPDVQAHNFMHELVHFVLYAAGEDQFEMPLHKMECLVDRIAGLLHQAFDTMEYDKPDETVIMKSKGINS